MHKIKATTINEYISAYPNDIQKILQEVRLAVRAAAPAAEETIKYGMPTFTLHGNLVYFGAFKRHLGFYPSPEGDKTFGKELAVYKSGKGSLQFPFGQPIPLDLIKRVVKLRLRKNQENKKIK